MSSAAAEDESMYRTVYCGEEMECHVSSTLAPLAPATVAVRMREEVMVTAEAGRYCACVCVCVCQLGLRSLLNQ